MKSFLLKETELPGRRINEDTKQIIVHRYLWAEQFASQKIILEVGCGPGIGLGVLAAHSKHMVAGDLLIDNLKIAKNRYQSSVSLVQFDAVRLPFGDETFDLVVSLASIIYFDLAAFLADCRRVLRKDGMLVVNTPNKDAYGFCPSALGQQYYSVPELDILFEEQDFNPSFFGAFPTVSSPKTRICSRLVEVIRIGAVVLRKLGLGVAVNSVQNKRKPLTLGHEILKTDQCTTKDVMTIPLDPRFKDITHRIVYVTARK